MLALGLAGSGGEAGGAHAGVAGEPGLEDVERGEDGGGVGEGAAEGDAEGGLGRGIRDAEGEEGGEGGCVEGGDGERGGEFDFEGVEGEGFVFALEDVADGALVEPESFTTLVQLHKRDETNQPELAHVVSQGFQAA